MKRVFLIVLAVALIYGTNVSAFFLNLQTPTTYTDNTAFEPTIVVFIDAWVDGNVLATMYPTTLPATKIPLIDNTFGASHVYKVRTHLQDGRLSADYSATLSSPLDSRLPSPPGAAGVPLSITK